MLIAKNLPIRILARKTGWHHCQERISKQWKNCCCDEPYILKMSVTVAKPCSTSSSKSRVLYKRKGRWEHGVHLATSAEISHFLLLSNPCSLLSACLEVNASPQIPHSGVKGAKAVMYCKTFAEVF